MKKLSALPLQRWFYAITAFYPTVALIFGLMLYYRLPNPTKSVVGLIIIIALPAIMAAQIKWLREAIVSMRQQVGYVVIGIMPFALFAIPFSDANTASVAYGAFVTLALIRAVQVY